MKFIIFFSRIDLICQRIALYLGLLLKEGFSGGKTSHSVVKVHSGFFTTRTLWKIIQVL